MAKHIYDLSNEDLAGICQAICPHCEALTNPFAEPSSYEKAKEIMNSERESVKALASLCLVSRRFYGAAIRFLYHRPLVTDPLGHLRLMRTLTANAGLAAHVQSLALTDWSDYTWNLIGVHECTHYSPELLDPQFTILTNPFGFQSLSAQNDLAYVRPDLDFDDDGDDDNRQTIEHFSQYTLAMARFNIMCHAPNTRKLCVQLYDLKQLKPVVSHLPELRELIICPDRFHDVKSLHYWFSLPEAAALLNGLQHLRVVNLRDFECHEDMNLAGMSSLTGMSQVPKMSGIKELRLTNCIIGGDCLRWLLTMCDSLELFELQVAPSWRYEHEHDFSGEDLNQVLLHAPMQKTLKVLSLDMFSEDTGLPEDSALRVYHDLREFHFNTLSGTFEDPDLHERGHSRILEHMPSSIESLWMAGLGWDEHYCIEREFRRNLERIPSRFPNLRRVELLNDWKDPDLVRDFQRINIRLFGWGRPKHKLTTEAAFNALCWLPEI